MNLSAGSPVRLCSSQTLLTRSALATAVHRYSNLTCSNNLGDNPPENQLFQKRSELLPIGADGSVKLTVHPEEIYTLTTLKTGGKGIAPKPSPPSTPFPIPFHQDFDHENISAPPAYWCALQQFHYPDRIKFGMGPIHCRVLVARDHAGGVGTTKWALGRCRATHPNQVCLTCLARLLSQGTPLPCFLERKVQQHLDAGLLAP